MSSNKLIITPELLKKIGEEAPKSPAALEKLARAKAHYEKHKSQIDELLTNRFGTKK